MLRNINISEICDYLNLKYIGSDKSIDGLNLCNRHSEHMHVVSYVTSDAYVDILRSNSAIEALVADERLVAEYKQNMSDKDITYIVSEQPEKTFYDIHDFLYYNTDFYEKYEFETQFGYNCCIHSSAVIEKGVVIGNNVMIDANTVVRKGTVIEDNCIIGCNTTIGSEGFQVIRINGINRKVIHCGGVKIKQNVCIGDNNTIANALFEGHTHIGYNTKIDNLVYIGHMVYIGNNVVITSGCVLAGGVVIADGSWVGINSSIKNRVKMGKNSVIGMGSVVTKDILADTLVYGVPARMRK